MFSLPNAGSALLGGVLIGLSASGVWLGLHRIAGISGILGGVLFRSEGETSWRVSFLAGLLGGGVLLRIFLPTAFAASWSLPLPILITAGVLVGVGTRLGNGCTSGHGICGIARLSRRSVVATAIFLSVAVLVNAIVRRGLGAL